MMRIYCISILRVCDPGMKNYELKEAYETSFLSELYPGVALSKNTVSTFLNDLGKALSKIVRFMRNRTSAVSMDHHLLVDGTLKSNESRVNSLSDFSRKARTKGTRDISVLYAFDLESMEPVCSKCFPGNMLDFTGILPGYEGITYRKEKCTGMDKWLYSYRDSSKASKEENDWLRRAKKNRTYSLEALREKQKTFGTIVLECDPDLPPETAYKAYDRRWEIEIVMRFYKSACEFDEHAYRMTIPSLGANSVIFCPRS